MLIWADLPSGSQGIYGGQKARMLDGIWAEVTDNASLGEDPDPNITGSVLHFGAAHARFVLPATTTTVGIATRIWLDNIPNSNGARPAFHQFRDVSNNVVLLVFVSPTGSIQVYRDADGVTGAATLIGQTAGPVMVAQSWRHVETKAFRSTTVGTVEVRVEGVTVLSLTNVNTGAADYAQVAIGNTYSLVSTGTIHDQKDVIFWNGSGSENNTFIGPCGVYWCPPDADVSSGWSRTSGSTDWQLVNESPPNDSGYIYAGNPPPSPSIMNVVDLPPEIVAIRGIISVVRSEKSDGGDGNEQNSLSPNGTDWDDGADNPISTAFSYYFDVSEVSPDTTAPWTPVEFSTLQLKLNRTV